MAILLPLSEANGREIIVRTVYQIVRADYQINPEQYDRPADRLYELAYQWRLAGIDLVADTLQEAAGSVLSGHTIATWRSLSLAIGSERLLALARLGRQRRR